jgi:cytochrome c oxidase subunit 4
MSTHTEVTTNTHAEGHAHAHGGPAVYTRTLIALLILTGITVGAAYINLGAGNVVVALFIATIKATLVGLFFMHLLWDKPVNRIIAMGGFLFLGIFLMFCLLDFDSRNNFLPQSLHQPTVMPLAPGTAPQALTNLIPDTGDTSKAAPAAAGKEEKK